MASSGVFESDHQPQATAKSVRTKIRNRFRELASMIRSMKVAGAGSGGVMARRDYQDLRAPCTFDSASTRKLALLTTRSPSARPRVTW